MTDHVDSPDDPADEGDLLEAYCVSCRQKTPVENPQAIWTRRGAPGTRGTCADCGTTVIRMGRTAAHARLRRPEPAQLADLLPGKTGRKALPMVYVNHSAADAEFAEIVAEDLRRAGVHTWLPGAEDEGVPWATGVHPALVECAAMLVIATPLAVKATNVRDALEYFVKTRKPVVVAVLEPADLPDSLRRRPRFDFSGDDYKRQLRALIAALSG
jgi:hypothetical protein